MADRQSVGIGAKWDKTWRRRRDQGSGMANVAVLSAAAEFLAGCEVVEDWGCGPGLFREYLEPGIWRGVDACAESAAVEIADLSVYRSEVDGVYSRGVVEHNETWRDIVANALASYRRQGVLVFYLPFSPAHTSTISGRFLVQRFTRREVLDSFGGRAFEERKIRGKHGFESLFLFGGE